MNLHPRIDVILPVYNGEKYVERALRSVLSQTLSPSRIIIINDGSTDRTGRILDDFKSKYGGEFEIIILLGPRRGLSAARNCALREVNAGYVACIDADDEWLPNKLEKQIEKFRISTSSKLAVVSCMFDIKPAPSKLAPEPDSGNSFKGQALRKILINNYNLKSPSLCMFRSEIIKKIGLFDETLSIIGDWDYYVRIAERYEFDYIPEVLVHIWDEPDSLSKKYLNSLRELLRFIKKWQIYYVDDEMYQNIAARFSGLVFAMLRIPEIKIGSINITHFFLKRLSSPFIGRCIMFALR